MAIARAIKGGARVATQELVQLRSENKRLKSLLKNAVELLERYKLVLTRAASKPPRKARAGAAAKPATGKKTVKR